MSDTPILSGAVARGTDTVVLGSEKMRQARKRRRLSVEELAVNMRRNDYRVTGRTYARWEKAGEVPRPAIPAVAAVLGLDLGEILADQPSRVPWQRVEDVLLEIQETQRVLVSLLAEQRDVVLRLETIATRLQASG